MSEELDEVRDLINHLARRGIAVSDVGETRCLRCDGLGRRHYSEDRDFYEGYKLVDKRECRECSGTGRVQVNSYLPRFREERERARRQRAIDEAVANVRRVVPAEVIDFIKRHM